MFVQCVCVCLITHLCPPEWATAIQSLCAHSREETRGPSRHEITNYTLRATPRGLHRAQPSKNWRGAKEKNPAHRQGWRGGTKGRKANKVVTAVNSKWGGDDWVTEKTQRKCRNPVCLESEKERRKMRAAECYCASLSGRQSVFIAQSPTIRGEVFSAWLKTIQRQIKIWIMLQLNRPLNSPQSVFLPGPTLWKHHQYVLSLAWIRFSNELPANLISPRL